jgi:oxygen-independent coproporphyrinogen-3 oxidase
MPRPAADVGVYLHVPFCERVCPYCDFAVEGVGALDAATERAFTDTLLRELDLAAGALAGRRLATVYFGGGTPSLLAPGSVERVLEALRRRFVGEPGEVTLELNPGRVELARVPGFRAAGVSRISVGAQAFDDTTLRRLGRAHAAADALRGLEACLAAGFPSLSVDLIFGAPGQTPEGFLRDVERVCDLEVPHVSAYALTLEPGTPFHGARDRLALPDEDAVLAMAHGVRARLAAAGLAQYEISSFARPGHRSRHNQRYWLREDVLGLGPSAASLLGDRRTKNAPRRGEWAAAIARGERAVAEEETLDLPAIRREALYLGLRRIEGVPRAEFQRRFGAPPERWFGAEIEELRGLCLLCDAGGRLRLTERGIHFADEVFLRFAAR